MLIEIFQMRARARFEIIRTVHESEKDFIEMNELD
jgi:hypothetical protein